MVIRIAGGLENFAQLMGDLIEMDDGRGNMLSDKNQCAVLLADDHVLIRHGIKNIIKKDERINVVGEVGNGKELMGLLEEFDVDLIILDISMPDIGGMEAIGLVKEKYPWIKILMLTMHKNKQYFYNAMAAGADGYLMKDDSDDELLIAIEKVLAGKCYISPYMTDEFADDVISMYRNDRRSPFQELTKREKEILQFVVQGLTSRQMAEQLNLSQRTVDHHRSNLLRKFDRKNSVELVHYAVRNGFVSSE
ncbi:response regulator transcription factor [Desulforhopalus sp. IMCC35007]|uniref:response regulator n=1 Tax=Desulforhopalus sp. IMCC35007 TaxID=2569543 RepID=UPI001F0E1261|nr:response regulator transcription factor [Desulforhopalus sp. IMCC35007]